MGLLNFPLTLVNQLNAKVMQLKGYTCAGDPRLAKISINNRFYVSERRKVVTYVSYPVLDAWIRKPKKPAVKIVSGNTTKNSEATSNGLLRKRICN